MHRAVILYQSHEMDSSIIAKKLLIARKKDPPISDTIQYHLFSCFAGLDCYPLQEEVTSQKNTILFTAPLYSLNNNSQRLNRRNRELVLVLLSKLCQGLRGSDAHRSVHQLIAQNTKQYKADITTKTKNKYGKQNQST